LCALARSDPRWRLVVVGCGPERERLDQLADALGLSNRVQFVGLQSEDGVRALLDRSAAFALACRVAPDGDRDGIPVALMEAMARRVPVVTTDVSAISELVGGAGVLVPAGDAAAFADGLDTMIDPARREEVGGAGRDRVAGDFVVEHSARRVAAWAVEDVDDELSGAG
jgi:glycosyltransferase involved in cell wall biosynthesis